MIFIINHFFQFAFQSLITFYHLKSYLILNLITNFPNYFLTICHSYFINPEYSVNYSFIFN